jgi:small subunit ribosomal protein S16
MLAIRMQRTGRKGHAQFRMVVQDARFNPQSGRVVAYLGFYDPHSKTGKIDGDKASKYLDNGAQPSDRAVRVLQSQGIKLPNWVSAAQTKDRAVRHPEKRRSTTPKEEAPVEAEAPAEDVATETEAPAAEEAPASEDTGKSSDKSA